MGSSSQQPQQEARLGVQPSAQGMLAAPMAQTGALQAPSGPAQIAGHCQPQHGGWGCHIGGTPAAQYTVQTDSGQQPQW